MKLVIEITGASGVQLNRANIGVDKRNRRCNESRSVTRKSSISDETIVNEGN